MSKSIHTLVKDIQEVINKKGGWDELISAECADKLRGVLDQRLIPSEEQKQPSLRMSQLGTPCTRKLWYSLHSPSVGEGLPASARLKFLYGDILEQLLISLAHAAGHKVEGEQDVLEISGIKGHRDCVIDGITIDVKSASPYSFKKFAEGTLRDNDPFGYISQLSSYVYAGRDSPVESHPTLGAFLVVDKVNGHICLDMYDFGNEIDNKLDEIQRVKDATSLPEPPQRAFSDIPEGKSGNRKLDIACSYCEYKRHCWPSLRTFAYSTGPVFLTNVRKEPRVPEITE